LNAWKILLTKDSKKDYIKIAEGYPSLKRKVESLLELLMENPYKVPPKYEKLTGNFLGLYSRRINIQHRLIYQVFEDKKIVKILAMWAHYE
jgi:Txe/YoeB family toxin of toxin-antitoxin system